MDQQIRELTIMILVWCDLLLALYLIGIRKISSTDPGAGDVCYSLQDSTVRYTVKHHESFIYAVCEGGTSRHEH